MTCGKFSASPGFSPLRTRVAHPHSSLCTMRMAAATVHFWGPACILASWHMEPFLGPWPEPHSGLRPVFRKPGLLLSPEPLFPSCAFSALGPLFLLHLLCFLTPSSPLILSFHTSSQLITPLGLSFPFPVCFPSGALAVKQLRENAQLSGTRKSLCMALIHALRSHNFSRLSSQLSFRSPSLPACAHFCAAPQRKLP